MASKRQGRLQRIVELIEERGKLETGTLAQELGVTELTIRRDIDQLDADGIVRRVYGGAIRNAGRSFEPPFGFRLTSNVEAKQAIAKEVVARIPHGSNVAIDFGTKAYYVAQEMRRQRLQILAAPTSVQVIELLGQDSDLQVLAPGGEVKPVELSFYGSVTEQFFREHRWDVAIVSVAGVSVENNVMSDYSEADARLKAAMVASADRVIVLAETRHLGVASFAPVAPLTAISTLITDASGPHDVLTVLEQSGVEVVRAVR